MFQLLAENTNNKGSAVMSYVLIGVIILGFIGFMIWSNYNNKKQQKKHAEKLKSLQAGTKVVTRGGICGIVESVNLEEGTFVLKVGEDLQTTYLTFVLEAIYLAGAEAEKTAARVAPVQTPVENKENNSSIQ